MIQKNELLIVRLFEDYKLNQFEVKSNKINQKEKFSSKDKNKLNNNQIKANEAYERAHYGVWLCINY